MPARYPDELDFERFLLSTGLVITSEPEEWYAFFDTKNHIQTGVNNVTSDCGRGFLPVEKTLTFTPPDGSQLLDLGDDLRPSPTPVVSYMGTAMARGTDYIFMPSNADQNGKPWRRIYFLRPIWMYPPSLLTVNSLTVVGEFSYSAEVPADIFYACMESAFIDAHPQLALAISEGLLAWKDKDHDREFSHYGDQGPLTAEVKQMRTNYANHIDSYIDNLVGL